MKSKRTLKICVDISMITALLFLMAYSLIGETAHEWIGIAMLILFVMHHMLNSRWARNIFNGKYTVVRVWQTVLVFAVLVCMAGSMLSGIVLSRHVFSFLPIRTGQGWARTMHLLCAYWGLVVMSLHIGFHFSILTGMIRKHIGEQSAKYIWLIRIASIGIAIYGVIAFANRQISSYIFMKNEFVYFDFEEPMVLFFVDYLAIMGLFVFIGHYFTKLLKWFKLRRKYGEGLSVEK